MTDPYDCTGTKPSADVYYDRNGDAIPIEDIIGITGDIIWVKSRPSKKTQKQKYYIITHEKKKPKNKSSPQSIKQLNDNYLTNNRSPPKPVT